ncbi:MAG: hypothetical protein KAR55_03105 [Thermoplasmatales archaeon]|nr:hypothetical protein [Thermoplasmatales archaeon]
MLDRELIERFVDKNCVVDVHTFVHFLHVETVGEYSLVGLNKKKKIVCIPYDQIKEIRVNERGG